jgi:PAS domain S-box-containing protein
MPARTTNNGALTEAEQHLRLFVEEVRDYAVIMLDPNGYVASWNKGAQLIKGYAAHEIVGKHFSRFYTPEDIEAGKPERGLKLAASNGRFREVGTRVRKDGTRYTASIVITPIVGKRGKLLGFGKITHDVSEREASEQRDRSDKARLRSLFTAVLDTLIDALIVIDGRGHITAYNQSAERMFGYPRDEVMGKNVKMLMPPEIGAQHDGYIRNYQTTGIARIIGISREVTGQRRDGSRFPVHLAVGEAEHDGQPIYVGIVRDLTERERVEEQLRQSQKMEAVGQLTGGIAHDFNNILMIIMTNADAVLEDGTVGVWEKARLEEIGKAAQRAADLTRQLLAFSRRQSLQPVATNLNEIVNSTSRLLRRTLGDHVEFRSILADKLGTVSIDRTQFESLLVNLCLNARDAMPGGGTLTVETSNVVLDEDYVALNPEAVPGPYAMLAVSDTGIGIPAQALSRVFEPFFTTKPVGKGTGLGLSMVYGFVKQSNGHIKIYSEVGKGTTIRVYLPTSDDKAEALDRDTGTRVTGGSESVLVVEDDDQVRAAVAHQLASLGYAVAEAADGARGLAAFQRARKPFDLLVTDVVMPGPIAGQQLAQEVMRRWPGTPVVFMSGYTEDSMIRQGNFDPGVHLLTKPFRKRELARVVREALDRRRT